MKFFSIGAFSLILALVSSIFPTQKNGDVTVSCELENCGENLKIFQFDGVSFYEVQAAKVNEEGLFKFNIPKGNPSFYYIGLNAKSVLPIVLGPEELVKISGDCNQIRDADISSSAYNMAYRQVRAEVIRRKKLSNNILNKIHATQRQGKDPANQIAELQELDKDRIQYMDSIKKVDPFYGGMVAINTFPSFYSEIGKYENEIDHFANEYFSQVDFKDEVYDRLPWVYETSRDFSNTLSKVVLTQEDHKEYLENALDKWPLGSKAQQLAFGGMLAGMRQRNHPNFIYFGDKFVEIFSTINPKAAASVKTQVGQLRGFMVGGEAPEFSQKTPDGEELKLSDMRGKVLLVDFWASWCGPCRKENPNVVKLYNRYKDQGFEILGVSLDRQKERWVKAIEQDGLEWQHVSDLKGWQNEVAQMYNVSSIPHTILLDKEGKVLARNLRGAKLEQKLEELFD